MNFVKYLLVPMFVAVPTFPWYGEDSFSPVSALIGGVSGIFFWGYLCADALSRSKDEARAVYRVIGGIFSLLWLVIFIFIWTTQSEKVGVAGIVYILPWLHGIFTPQGGKWWLSK
jgi:hypothetical protein